MEAGSSPPCLEWRMHGWCRYHWRTVIYGSDLNFMHFIRAKNLQNQIMFRCQVDIVYTRMSAHTIHILRSRRFTQSLLVLVRFTLHHYTITPFAARLMRVVHSSARLIVVRRQQPVNTTHSLPVSVRLHCNRLLYVYCVRARLHIGRTSSQLNIIPFRAFYAQVISSPQESYISKNIIFALEIWCTLVCKNIFNRIFSCSFVRIWFINL